eukprot:7398167-Lingulodinium_polyedra.AAC.1
MEPGELERRTYARTHARTNARTHDRTRPRTRERKHARQQCKHTQLTHDAIERTNARTAHTTRATDNCVEDVLL